MATTAPTTTPAATESTAATGTTTPPEAAKPKTVLDDMESRRVFDSTADATTYLAKCMADFSDFEGYPVAAPGLDAEGNFDPEIYTDAMQVGVAVLSQRGEGANSSTVKAIVIYPSPSLDSILANDAARDWLTRIVHKELNHVAVRQLRKAENIADVIDQMPTTLEDYITSNRETGGILQAYEDLWKGIKKTLGIKFRPWALQNLSKKEMRRGMESASYAAANYPTLEDRGDKPSLFVLAAQLGELQAKKAGADPAIFQRWLATRNEKTIDVKAEDEDENISLDDLEAAFTSDDSATPAPADGEAPATPDAAPEGEPTEENTAPESNDTDGAAA